MRAAGLCLLLILTSSCDSSPSATQKAAVVATPADLAQHCRDAVGEPRIEKVSERVWLAIGHDLANTMLIRTDAGHVVVDVGSDPVRAARVREALLRSVPGKIAALIYTHSHIDHVGGAGAWVDDGTQIWATEAFGAHFLKQYGAFSVAESRRGGRQFGQHVPDAALPCSALGKRVDVEQMRKTGVRMPTHTFSGEHALQIGGVTIELHEAHGETHDQLFVYLPGEDLLMPGDNYYAAFPNLYTIRGTSPRPVDAWIDSLDRMRRIGPAHLVPSHTAPVHGKEAVADTLRAYRDAIQYVRDRVVADANAGLDVDRIAERASLPPSLAKRPELRALYGQLDWSARAMYGNALGWFDGRAETLYPLPVREQASRSVALMGGADKIRQAAKAASEAGEHRWAAHLWALLRDSGDGATAKGMATALEGQAADVANTNGRAYLLEVAYELRHGATQMQPPSPDEALIDAVPLDHVFRLMAARLIPAKADGVHEAVRFEFEDGPNFTVTIRNGIAEVLQGEPLAEGPAPLATVKTDAGTWRRLAVDALSPIAAVASGRLAVEGELLGFYSFTKRFRRGME